MARTLVFTAHVENTLGNGTTEAIDTGIQNRWL
jgi:hypothetical protein